MGNWWTVAENELLLLTSRFHGKRKLLVAIILAVFAAHYYVIFTMVQPLLFIPDVKESILSNKELVYYFILLIYFFGGVMVFFTPISGTLREVNVIPIEIVLSSPIKPRHVFLGQFVSRAVVYTTITLLILVPFDVIMSLLFDASILGILVFNILTIFYVLFFLWLSVLIIAVIMSKLGHSSRGQDIAKAINMLLGGLVFVVLYLTGYFSGSINLTTLTFLLDLGYFLPYGWIANTISFYILGYPENVPVLLNLACTALTFAAVIFGGYYIAERFYVVEPVELHRVTIKHEFWFYKFIRKVIPGKLGELTVLHFKEFSRYYESLSKFAYSLAISIVLIYVMTSAFAQLGEDLLFFIISFILPYAIPLIGVMISSDITIRGKEKLWIYRHIPYGVRYFVLGKFIQSSILLLPVAIVIPLLLYFTYPPLFGGSILLFFLAYSLTLAFSVTAISVGIFCINPAFKEKSAKFTINVLITMGITMFLPLFAIPITIASALFSQASIHTLVFLMSGTFAVIDIVAGIVLMWLGMKRLSSIE
ncbi:MAG: hypothetical protein J7L47_11200 [Candidatus Odinarchaeota archaeon]|nr:hypothetical protein [Candidatus Odinarchaeota archaeon]